jgi:hypothetical protein
MLNPETRSRYSGSRMVVKGKCFIKFTGRYIMLAW